jgi:hypothetical protein
MNTIERRSSIHSTLTTSLLMVLFLILLGGVERAQAQWSSSSGNTTTTDNVGIGTTGPNAKLDVNGDIMLGGANTGTLYPSTAGQNIAIRSRASDIVFGASTPVDYMTIKNGGNVGIGTTNPNSLFDVSSATARFWVGKSSATAPDGNISPRIVIGDTTTVNPGILTLVSNDTTSGDSLGVISFANYSLGTTDKRIAGIGGLLDGASNSGALTFSVWNSGTPSEAVRINRSGSVGIGTSTPDSNYKLDVNGSVHVSGNIAAKLQDVAEWVPATHSLPVGTVVILNPTKSNEVMASITAYDTRVAGVVSERPGLILGEEGKDKVMVATTGRVKVKVDATIAPIHIGDLLVTSDEEGVAMKSEPVDLGGVKIHRPGTLIGKALEPLEKGTGEILVLLSLQ